MGIFSYLIHIAFMILGWFMARRYVLSKEKNAKVEKYLAYQREGRLDELSEQENDELSDLKKSLG